MGRLSRGLRTALIFLLAGILMFLYFGWRLDVFFSETSVDIHIRDTYFVVANYHMAIAVLLVLTLFFSLGGMIGSRFKTWLYIILFLIATSFIIYIVVSW
jgi:heme/copper-type cytochrome/quinol oxidase subunit 1